MKPGQKILEIKNLYVYKGGKTLVRDVSLTLNAGEFVAIVGPNGAGKTTLLYAIAGEIPYAGKIIFKGRELYQAPEHWLPQIGLLPTENVLHETLRVRSALWYVGRLRDLSDPDLRDKVFSLLEEFNLTHLADELIGTLSSGERKRANICAELLTEPPLLLLDEPTSDLDPDAERQVMQSLRRRAKEKQQAILIVSHTLNSLDCCHRVIFMGNSRILADAPPSTVPDVLHVSGESENERWVNAFKEHETERRQREPPPSKERTDTGIAIQTGSAPSSVPVWRQFVLLLCRYINALWNDGCPIPRTRWIFPLRLLVLPPAIGVLAGFLLRLVLQAESFIRTEQLDSYAYARSLDIGDVRQALFLVALVAVLIGLTGSFREIANEIAIYRHERLKGLHPGAYLLSKFVLLGLLFGVIAPLCLVWTLVTHQPFPTEGVFFSGSREALVTVVLTALATVGLGLAISAVGSKREYATFLMGLAVIAHALLSGLVSNRQWEDLINLISLGVASRWTMEGLSTTVGVYCWAQPRFRDYHSLGHLTAVWLALITYLLASLGIAYVALRYKDTWFRPAQRLRSLLTQSHAFYLLVMLAVAVNSWYLYSTSLAYFDRRTHTDIRVRDSQRVTGLQRLIGVLSEARCPEEAPLVSASVTSKTTITTLPRRNLVLPASPANPPSASTMPELTTALTTPTPPPTQSLAPIAPLTRPDKPTATTTPVSEPTPTPTSTARPAVRPLPQGTISSATELRYGPGHPAMASLPPGTNFTLLGKASLGGALWLRVQAKDSAGAERFGWIQTNSTELETLSEHTAEIPAPPDCSVPVANTVDHFSDVDVGSGQLGTWQSNVNGNAVFVVSLFRPSPGAPSNPLTFQIRVDGAVQTCFDVPASKGALLMRDRIFEVRLKAGNRVELSLAPKISTDLSELRVFTSVFAVPEGCEFNR